MGHKIPNTYDLPLLLYVAHAAADSESKRSAGKYGGELTIALIGHPATIVNYLRWELGHKLGVNLVTSFTDDMLKWLRRMATGEFDLSHDARLIWGDPLTGLHHIYHSAAIRPNGIFTNYAAYANLEVDALLDAAGRETDAAKRRALYARFQAIAAHDLPYLWGCHFPSRMIAHRALALPTDSPWATAQPYDEVHRRHGAPQSFKSITGQ